jgi:tetratricopeptide (TPR) repeat protein
MLDLNAIRALRQAGQHEEARQLLVQMTAQYPQDAVLNYETACVHDFLGFERAAIPFYLTAIQNGLAGSDLRGAYLGLGSTYRALGMAAESQQTFLEGLEYFPEAAEIKVFLAMTLFNLGEYHAAVSSLLRVIADTSADPHTQHYQRAIRLYAEDLNKRWA